MHLLEKIKCSLNTKLSDYYAGLTKDQLKEKKYHNFAVFLSLSTIWAIVWIIIVWATSIETPLAILFSGTVLATIISLWADYQTKKRLIDRLLRKK